MNQPAIRGTGAAIVKEEYALSQSPQRRRPEFVGSRCSLRYVVCQSAAHVVNEQVRIEGHGLVAEARCEFRRGGLERRRMAGVAVDLAEQRFSILNGRSGRIAREFLAKMEWAPPGIA